MTGQFQIFGPCCAHPRAAPMVQAQLFKAWVGRGMKSGLRNREGREVGEVVVGPKRRKPKGWRHAGCECWGVGGRGGLGFRGWEIFYIGEN